MALAQSRTRLRISLSLHQKTEPQARKADVRGAVCTSVGASPACVDRPWLRSGTIGWPPLR